MVTALNVIRNIASMPRLLVRADPVAYYRHLGDDVVEGEAEGFRDASKPLWLNLGYWETARTYVAAARAMAQQLGEAAQLCAHDHLLDVGFGFAEQDLYWVEHFDVEKITGLNITPMQVERARMRVDTLKLNDRIDLRVGSATAIPFDDSSFTKVTALECAHHFATREDFFHEAFRVLKPGGRLALCDGVPAPGYGRPSLYTKMILRYWASPIENFYDCHVYKSKLEACGFSNVVVRSIARHVFPGTLKYSDLRRSGCRLEDAVIPQLDASDLEEGMMRWQRFGLTDYLLVSADRPHA